MKTSLNDINSLPQWVFIAPFFLIGLLALCWIAFFVMYASDSPALSTLVGLMIGLVVVMCLYGGFFAVVSMLPD